MATTQSQPAPASPSVSDRSRMPSAVKFPVGTRGATIPDMAAKPTTMSSAPSTSSSDRSTLINTPPSAVSTSNFTSPDDSPQTHRKKKESLLHKFSRSSRRSMGFHPHHSDDLAGPDVPSEEGQGGDLSLRKSRRTLSLTSPFQLLKTLGPSPKADGRPPTSTPELRSSPMVQASSQKAPSSESSKGSLGKGFRSVARTVKKSLHQLDRPLGLLNERKEHSTLVPSTSSQPTTRLVQSVQPALETVEAPRPISSALRNRAISGPLAAQTTLSNTKMVKSMSQHTAPRPTSALEPGYRAIPTFGSLPQAASILARSTPDPTTFLAIIPGQPSNLTLVPPPSRDNFLGDPNLSATTARFPPSLQAQPASSSRNSPSELDDEKGFTFIRTPDPENPTERRADTASEGQTPSYLETGSLRRVPSDLEDFTSADWSQLIDQSVCYPNIGNRHQPILASDPSHSLSASDLLRHSSDSSLSDPVDSSQQSTTLSRSQSDPDLRHLDVARLTETSLMHSAGVLSSWRAPADWETSLDSETILGRRHPLSFKRRNRKVKVNAVLVP